MFHRDHESAAAATDASHHAQAPHPSSTHQRLARLAAMCLTDQQSAAELELSDWFRQSDAPAEVVLLLAGLLARRGELDHAIDLLSAEWAASEATDPRVIQCLIAALLLEGNTHAANDLTVSLGRQYAGNPHVDAFIQLMRTSAPTNVEVDDLIIDSVAADLLRQPEVIPSLVAAQKLSPQARDIALLRSALARGFGDIEHERQQLTACIAQADLAMLAGDDDDARRWAHRGLRIDPYSAPLALVLSRFDDDADYGPPTITVLNEAVRMHPKYPDLRAALIRREFAQGQADSARQRLAAWLQREPNQTLALRLEEEMAA